MLAQTLGSPLCNIVFNRYNKCSFLHLARTLGSPRGHHCTQGIEKVWLSAPGYDTLVAVEWAIFKP